MIPLHPKPFSDFICPNCGTKLNVKDWSIPGMHSLVQANCDSCHGEFYCDLPVGHALYEPLILSKSTGEVFDPYNVPWLANPFEESFRNQSEDIVPFEVEVFKELSRCVLVNCLDFLYGHSLLKLLNVQYYLDHCPDLGCIVMIPKQFRWLVPDGLAEIWTVDLPLSQGTGWYKSLEQESKKHITSKAECFLSVAFSHPHPDDFDIERFTRVRPFDMELWQERLDSPEVSFIWREDRLWLEDEAKPKMTIPWRNILRKIPGASYAKTITWQLLGLNGPKMKSDSHIRTINVRSQQEHVRQLAEMLRDQLPGLVFNVVGFGGKGGFPDWINDYRKTALNEDGERTWCKIYARSHIVVGVHGSNMLLPSAHAGSVVDIMPDNRLGNILQDVLFRCKDARGASFLQRFLPIETKSDGVSRVIESIIRNFEHNKTLMSRVSTKHARG